MEPATVPVHSGAHVGLPKPAASNANSWWFWVPMYTLSGHSPGQSGHPGSKHYDDFIKPWLKVEHHPMLFERNEIEANAEGMLRIVPK